MQQLIAHECDDLTNCYPSFLSEVSHISNKIGSTKIAVLDGCCFYYFARNSLVASLEALCAQIIQNVFGVLKFLSRVC